MTDIQAAVGLVQLEKLDVIIDRRRALAARYAAALSHIPGLVQIADPAWYEFLVIPVAFCISNAFEWWIHRYVMHRPVKGFMGIYKRHTLAHHQFFTNVEPTIDSTRPMAPCSSKHPACTAASTCSRSA